MKKQTIFTVVSAGLISLGMVSSADAALVQRLGGLAYYDNVADLTWLADANAAGTTMNWVDANNWATNFNVAGVTGWRLADSDGCLGFDCTSSEMGGLFYTALSNSTGSLTNTGPFSNIQSDSYWLATEWNSSIAWFFNMGTGGQNLDSKTGSFYGWAVQSGDVSAVPVPAAVWLFGSGLLGLVGVARRKCTNI